MVFSPMRQMHLILIRHIRDLATKTMFKEETHRLYAFIRTLKFLKCKKNCNYVSRFAYY